MITILFRMSAIVPAVSKAGFCVELKRWCDERDPMRRASRWLINWMFQCYDEKTIEDMTDEMEMMTNPNLVEKRKEMKEQKAGGPVRIHQLQILSSTIMIACWEVKKLGSLEDPRFLVCVRYWWVCVSGARLRPSKVSSDSCPGGAQPGNTSL